MSGHRLRTFDEIAEALRNAPPPTSDDVSITRDGERLDSAEKVRAWVARENAERRFAGGNRTGTARGLPGT